MEEQNQPQATEQTTASTEPQPPAIPSPVRIPSNSPLLLIFKLLNVRQENMQEYYVCATKFLKQLAKSTGTGLGITFAFRMLRHIRNIGKPGKIITDLFNFYRTKGAYSTGLLCFILCFFIRGGIIFQKLYREKGNVNYFVPGAIAGFLGVMAIEEDSRTPLVCYIFARALEFLWQKYKRKKGWKTGEYEYALLFIFTSSWMGYYYTFEKDCMPISIRKLYEKFVNPTHGENLLRELCHNYRANEIQKMLQRRGLA
jgi:hypothetical protein